MNKSNDTIDSEIFSFFLILLKVDIWYFDNMFLE